MSGSRFDDRVRDLLADAEAFADRHEWDGVRDLAGAALLLAPANADAQRLLAVAEANAPAPGERRQITVMFCDVVGSTALSAQRDPEVVREVLRQYQTACDSVVREYDGYVANYSGDGALIYFGHPVPHEDDPRRAVRAGLDLIEVLKPVTTEARDRFGIDLAVRAAVHTGLVVRADMGSPSAPDRDAIVGEAPNLAARLQDHATPGRLLISGATYDLVRGWFTVVPAGQLELKGIADPVSAYEVLEEIPGASRLDVQFDLSPLVGRDGEVAALTTAWESVCGGATAGLFLTGDPGVGKSRLADVIQRRASSDDGFVLVAHCSSYRQSSALHPVGRMIEQALGIGPDQTPEQSAARLWSTLDDSGLPDAVPLFADLLSLPPTEWAPAHELDGARLREALLTTLLQWVRVLAERAPTLVVVDDAQWADPSTIDLLTRVLAAKIPRLLVVITARDGFKAPWPSLEHLRVERLTTEELAELAGRLPEGRALPPDLVARAVERSDGIPLFLEELVRASAGADPYSSIPSSLRDLLLARFAAPGTDLGLAQAIATIGVATPIELIEQVVDLERPALDRQLATLVDASVLVRDVPDGRYRFRHQLLADLAYETQLAERRRSVHSRVADALGAGADADHALVAHHLELAERFTEAAISLTSAAEAAQSLGGYDEAGALLDRALTLLDRVGTSQRAAAEFSVRLLRAMNVAVNLGYAAPSVMSDLQQAAALVPALSADGPGHGGRTRVTEHSERLWSVMGLWSAFLLQGRIDDCRSLTSDALAHTDISSPLSRFLQACEGFITFFRGDWSLAERQLEQAVEVLPDIDLSPRVPLPNHPLPVAWGHLSMVRAVRGDLAGARRAYEEGRVVADAVPFPRGPFSRCYVDGVAAATELGFGDVTAAHRISAEQAELAERHGFTLWLMTGQLMSRMLELHADGDRAAGDQASGLLGLLQAIGVVVWLPCWMASLADLHLDRGEIDAAEPHLRAAVDLADQTGVHLWSAELARLTGKAALARDPGSATAIDDLRRAVDLAESQGATVFELRARTELCRHVSDRAALDELARLVDRLPVSPDQPDRATAAAVLAARR